MTDVLEHNSILWNYHHLNLNPNRSFDILRKSSSVFRMMCNLVNINGMVSKDSMKTILNRLDQTSSPALCKSLLMIKVKLKSIPKCSDRDLLKYINDDLTSIYKMFKRESRIKPIAITISDVLRNPNMFKGNLNLDSSYSSANISLMDVLKNLTIPWNQKLVWGHKVKPIIKQDLAARLIQSTYLRECFCNPRKLLCRARLEREFHALSLLGTNS